MTQLQRTTESFGGTDQRWLGSHEGTDSAMTVTLDYDSWESLVTNGRLKSGEPVAHDSSTDKWVPYDDGGSNDTNKIEGFLLTDVPVRTDGGDVVAPLMVCGRIILKYLPSTVAANATLATGAFFKLIDVEA